VLGESSVRPDRLALRKGERQSSGGIVVLMLIWLVAGLLLGLFVTRRAVALGLSAVVWMVAAGTVLARSEHPLAFDPDSVGVLATLVVAVAGCWLGAFVRTRRLAERGRAT
jgi:uncharacterized protein YneF (UPF0154 family)